MFIYREWEAFCMALREFGCVSKTAESVLVDELQAPFVVLKHDVETNIGKALELARIESRHLHRGSYYIQAYLLEDSKNIEILREIQAMGHEVSYHHEVMDAAKGDIDKAIEEFAGNVEMFRLNGFQVNTVCQHGNPIFAKLGYTSNRDFFRSKKVVDTFNDVSEIMVNFKSRINKDFEYVSDVGYGWKIISDPENADRVKKENISLKSLNQVLIMINSGTSFVVSTHPHRWTKGVVAASLKIARYRSLRKTGALMAEVAVARKIMERYYHLAKKI